MTINITYTTDNLQFLSLFQKITGVSPIDCVIEDDKISFIIKEKDYFLIMAKAQSLPIKGKKGVFLFLNKISKITSKKTEIIKYSEDVKIFISNYFFLKGDEEVKVLNKTSGGYVSAIMFIKPHRRGLIIGKQGKRIQDARNLLQKYFGFNKLYIK
tara:strand:- start:270 stop:737 length:468 start_codon:yes stop_codon:yes gene_type:complete